MRYENFIDSMQQFFSENADGVNMTPVAEKLSALAEPYLKYSVYGSFNDFMNTLRRLDEEIYNCVRTGLYTPAEPETASEFVACLLCFIAPHKFPKENYDFFTLESLRKDGKILDLLKKKSMQLIHESKLLSDSIVHAMYESPEHQENLRHSFREIDNKIKKVLTVSGYVINLIKFKNFVNKEVLVPVAVN